MVIDGIVMERHPVELRIPQSSLVSPILFAIYTSELIEWVEERVTGAEGLSCMDDVGSVATGHHVNQGDRKLHTCARMSIDWAK